MRSDDLSSETDEIRRRVAAHEPWYHQIELAPGVVTPGTHRSEAELAVLDRLGLPIDCRDMRILDIGCRDGFFAFEMERRGATVMGVDYAAPDVTGFRIAADILESSVEYRIDNVYSLDPGRLGTFDLILFLGVVYHLRNPMLALDRIRSVHREGGLLFVETQLATDERLRDHDTPLWQFYSGTSLYGDGSNRWAPNRAGLLALVRECEYEVLGNAWAGDRGHVIARSCHNQAVRYFRELDSSVDLWGR